MLDPTPQYALRLPRYAWPLPSRDAAVTASLGGSLWGKALFERQFTYSTQASAFLSTSKPTPNYWVRFAPPCPKRHSVPVKLS